MKVDANKYNAWFKTIKSISKEDFLNIRSSLQVIDTTRYIEDIDYFSISKKVWKDKESFNYPSYKKITEKYIIDFPNKELYIPNEDVEYKIPFEYYSKAYIPPLEFCLPLKNNEFLLRKLKFTLDCCGRLHVDKNCILNYIWCVEKELPEIQAEIIVDCIHPTTENYVELMNKSLNPYFILENTYENIYDYLAKKGTIAYDILKKANQLTLELFCNYLESSKNLKNLAGFIFEDGSYLLFSTNTFYHEYFIKYLIKKPLDYIENYWIKLNDLNATNLPIAIYHSKNITEKQRRTLRGFKRKYYIRDQDLDNGFVKYW